MGIGCACAQFNGDVGNWLERTYQCVIAVAKHIEVKTIIERIPGYMGLDFQLDYESEVDYMCSRECRHVNINNQLWKDLYEVVGDESSDLVNAGGSLMANTWCPEGERPDENLVCKTCDETLPGCSMCYRGRCFQCLDEFDDHYYYPYESFRFAFQPDYGSYDFEDHPF